MNAERLHIVAVTLSQELNGQNVIGTLQNLVNSLQSIVQSSNVNTQQNLVSSRDGFYAAVTDTRSDSFTPAWRQILVEMGGEELFGKRVDRGFNFEVRIEPPKPLPQDAKEASEVKQAVQTIQVASVNMQYMKLEGPPILALPEDIESATDGEGKHKKKSTTKKEDTK